jgi:hypothetical protein
VESAADNRHVVYVFVVNEFISIYLILLAALGTDVQSASERNEYQKQKNNVSVE